MKHQGAKMETRSSAQTQQEGLFVRRIRDLAGVASVVGFVLLTGYAFTNLRPGWQWTVEDQVRASNESSDDV